MSADARLSRANTPQSASTPWAGILIAVALSGAIPALWNLTLLDGLHHNLGFLVVYFALGALLPFACGYGATAFWRGATVGGVVMLAIAAAGAEALTEVFVLQHVTIHGVQLVLAPEDYVAWVAIFCMFAAGGLYRIRTATYSGKGVSADARTIRMSEVLHNTQTLLGIAGSMLTLYSAVMKL